MAVYVSWGFESGKIQSVLCCSCTTKDCFSKSLIKIPVHDFFSSFIEFIDTQAQAQPVYVLWICALSFWRITSRSVCVSVTRNKHLPSIVFFISFGCWSFQCPLLIEARGTKMRGFLWDYKRKTTILYLISFIQDVDLTLLSITYIVYQHVAGWWYI